MDLYIYIPLLQATAILGAEDQETTPSMQRALRKERRERGGRGRGRGRGKAAPKQAAKEKGGRGRGRGRGKKSFEATSTCKSSKGALKRPAAAVVKEKTKPADGKKTGCPKCRGAAHGCRRCNPNWVPRRGRRAMPASG